MKIVGVMLKTALLIIPAVARGFSSSPEQMVLIAIIFESLAVCFGLFGSLGFDTSSSPSIIASSLLLFIMSILPNLFSIRKKKNSIQALYLNCH